MEYFTLNAEWDINDQWANDAGLSALYHRINIGQPSIFDAAQKVAVLDGSSLLQ